jgi:hypothetical protein
MNYLGCNGNGVKTCITCHGQRTIMIPQAQGQMERRTCTTCGG